MFLGEVTRQRPHKTTLEEFRKDNAPSETRSLAYVAGTEEITPSRIWYGDFKARAVERDSRWTDYLFLGLSAALLDTITVAYRYYCGEAFALCYGPDRHIEQIKIADRLVYAATPGTDNAGGSFLIDDPQAWGGDQPPGEGGQYSLCDITRGNYTDPPNAYLNNLLATPPANIPGLNGILALISRGPTGFTESGYFAAGGVGFTPRFKEWKFTIRGQPSNLGVPEYSRIGRHANPAEVYYEHSVSLEYGAQVPVDELNLDSFRLVAQTLHSEGLGWTGKIENPTSPIEVCKNIQAQCDMIADPSPSLGLTLRLIRRDYSFGSLPIMNRDVITRTDRYSPGAYEDTLNKVEVAFKDQNNNFADRKSIYIDPANQKIQGGRTVPGTQEYLGVADTTMGNLLVTRDGRALSFPRGPLTNWVVPSWGKLRYRGEVIKWEWTNPTFSKIMRILAVTPGTARDPYYRIVSIEDQFATGARTFGEPSGTSHTDPSTGLNTAPPSLSWDTVGFPPDGLTQVALETTDGSVDNFIQGGIIFDTYAAGGQYARVYVTEPGGVETLSPMFLAPDANNKDSFRWPALTTGDYTFCIQTYSLRQATNGTKVCATITVTALSLRLLEDGSTRLLETGAARALE
jgi:hypothetical protein